MIHLSNMIAEDNFQNLCDLTTRLLDMRKGSLAFKSRKSEFQIPRSVVSVVARMIDKTHPTVIAKVLNRDRASVYHYERIHSSNYRSFPKYREIFNKVYNAYQSAQGSKRIFVDRIELKGFLKDNGVKNSEPHQTTIRIQSGKVGVDIKVSYKNFYNQLEKCKLALVNCKYNLEIV